MLLLNYKPVLNQPTGIGVYANAVLPAFDQFEHALIPGGAAASGKERLKRLAWSQFQLPRIAIKRKADLIFTPAPEGYLGEQVVPQVVMVHDLRPLSHPERSMQSVYFRNWVPQLLCQCRHILTNSSFTASEICRAIGVPEDKISVTPLGYDVDHFYPSELKQRLHHRPYLLNIGQAYPHKNLERLIHAFNAIAHRFPEVDLLLLGKPHPVESKRLKELTLKLGLSRRILFRSYVPYADLPNWYRGALAFVYPSLWEGFGLPILEAAACGCPIITSYGSATEEVANPFHSILVNPLSIDEITHALVSILESPARHLQLASNLVPPKNSLSWSATQRRTSDIIKKLLQD